MKHKKEFAGRFLSILLAAVMALSLLPADILSPAVHAEETDTGVDEDNGGTEAKKSVTVEKNGNAASPEESGTEEDDTEEPETEAGNTEGTESEAGSTDESESGAGSTDEPETEVGSTEGPGDGEEPGEGPAGTEKEDTAECVCGTLCTVDSANADCPVCGAEGAGIAGCKGEPEDTQDTGLCGHHPEHTQDCGYTEGTQDKEGTPCTYACRICPIEDLIAALPEEVTEDNAEDVRAQLDEILSLYKELTQEEQEQIDLSRCYALQEALDAAGVPVPLEDGEIPEDAVAKVETSGGPVTYVGKDEFANAFIFGDATITLLDNVTLNGTVTISSGTFTLDLNGKTLAGTVYQEASLEVIGGGILTIIDGPGGGKVTSTTPGIGLLLNGGIVYLNGGSFTDNQGAGVRCESGTLYVSGNATIGDVNGYSGLNIYHSGGSLTVQLSDGTYNDGALGAIFISSRDNMTVGDLLAEGYAYFNEDGTPVLDSLDKTLLPGPITVKRCNHEGIISYQSNNDGTHTLTCRACGYTETADCTCVLEGTVESSDLTHTAHLTEKCTVCGYSNALGDVTVTIPKLTYGETTGKKSEFKCETAIPFGSYQPDLRLNGISIKGSGFEQILAGLSAGEYEDRLELAVSYPVDATVAKPPTTTLRFPIPFTIAPAPLNEDMVTLSPESAIYTGAAQKPAITVTQGTNTLTVGTDYEISYSRGGTAATDFTNVGTVTVTVTGKGNYTGTATKEYTISYMAPPALLYDGSSEMRSYYNGDVAVTAVPSGSNTYTVSDAINGTYGGSYTIPVQEGTVEKTLYFKDGVGHISAGVPVTVKFDLTPPTGSISVGAKWWQNALHIVSFGHYKVQEYTVTIEAEDKGGSEIGSIDYAIVTGETQYADVNALENAVKDGTVSWTEYESGSKPTVPANSPCVVYARLTDNAGNITYISTEGMILDNTPPVVEGVSVPENGIKDVTAGITFKVSEAADYYYVVLEEGSTAPSAEDIIVTCGGTLPAGSDKTGTSIAGTVDSGRGAVSADTFPAGVSVDVKNLSPNTAYTVYVTAVDRALDIENRTPAGNIGNVAGIKDGLSFRTKKTLPVITKNPAVSGTYGQRVGEMTVTGGTVQGTGGAVLTGTWTVSSTDSGKEPAAGTKEEVTVIFMPDSDSYESVSVKVIPTVSPRSLTAQGVTISEVAGTYTYTGSEIKPPVAVNTGTSTSGISISDSGAVLTANDLTVSYSDNMNAGIASVTITGTGNYTGQVIRTFTIGKAPGRTIGSLSGTPVVDDKNQTYTYTITPIEGAVYRMGDSGWTGPEQKNGNVFTGITPGTTVMFYAKMPETPNYEEGEAKSITVDFPKLTPAAPALSYTRETDEETGKITLTIKEVTGAEYSFDGGQTWTDSNIKDGLDRSQTVTLAIRLKETDTHDPSAAQTVTVSLAKEDRGAPPAFTLSVEANGETDYTVTIPPTGGCEYSFDGKTWSDDHVKTGVRVGETVTGYMRYKETDDYNAGSAASAKATMPKFTVKTPVISPAGGAYGGSVSVTITCGSPDAEIYYTTDGSTPGRSSTRYTGAFTVSVPATVRAVAMKDGLNDSAAASETYTKKAGGSGSGGGNSGDNGDHSGGNDSGDSGSGNGGGGDNGGGNTAPGIPVTAPAPDTNPGTGTTERPGTGAAPGNGSTGETRPGQGIPFIKGEDGKTGWDVIRIEEEQAGEGSIINVDMNGTTVVPGDIFDSIKGRDITITFDMGNGIVWSVDGKSVTTDKAGDIDLSVKTGTDAVPVDIVNNVTGERYSIQISLAYDGEFGFTAVLFINLGKENAGYTASLYYYNEADGSLEFICEDEIAEDGTAELIFTHASYYLIVVDVSAETDDGNGGKGSAQPKNAETPDRAAGNDVAAEESPKTGQKGNFIWLVAAGILVFAGAGIAAVLAWRKKEKQKDVE